MAGRRSVTRWRDWREWQDVHAGLFSADLYEQQRAISRVAAWRSRGEVPVSVNATAQLVELAVHEQMANHQHHAIGISARSHMELSLAYSSAVVRCVNGLVDGSQKGTYAMAVSALAQRIGIPLWIVDLRHESTHNQLPSLPVLRFAADHLLAWLRSNYWIKQEEVLRNLVRQTGEVLLDRLPLLEVNCSSTDAKMKPSLKDVLDAEKVRDAVVPLLVDGHEFNERVLPTGVLFLAEFLLPDDSTKGVTEAEALDKYPKDTLIQLVLEVQSLSANISARLLAALCEKVFRPAQAPAEQMNSAEVEVAFFWIKLLISNEWRERLKYADEPVDEIYRCGASMLALSERVARGDIAKTGLVERVRAVLRLCKGIRNHTIVARDLAMRKQLGGSSDGGWVGLTTWNSSPLGQLNAYTGPDFATAMEYPLAIDQESSQVYTSPQPNVDIDEDDAIDRLMESMDAAYDCELNETIVLERHVLNHVTQGTHANTNQKVLPQQEVERIQNEIEIW